MKKGILKYDILANYHPDEDITIHLLIFKNIQAFTKINPVNDYQNIFHKVLPKYDIPSFLDITANWQNVYVMLTSQGNPYKIKEPYKDVRIHLYDVKEANIYKKDIPIYYQFPASYTSYPTF